MAKRVDKSRFRFWPKDFHWNRQKPDRLLYHAKVEMWFSLGNLHWEKSILNILKIWCTRFRDRALLGAWDIQLKHVVMISMIRDRNVVGQISGVRGPESSLKGSPHSHVFVGQGYMEIHTVVGNDQLSFVFCHHKSPTGIKHVSCKTYHVSVAAFAYVYKIGQTFVAPMGKI